MISKGTNIFTFFQCNAVVGMPKTSPMVKLNIIRSKAKQKEREREKREREREREREWTW